MGREVSAEETQYHIAWRRLSEVITSGATDPICDKEVREAMKDETVRRVVDARV